MDLEFLAAGLDADVYALDEHRVLRRYRRGGDVAPEIEIMKYVRRKGFPAPEVLAGAGGDLELERLYGPTMVEALLSNEFDIDGAVRMLADLHERLHALPPLRSTEPGASVIHRDLHPNNVILTATGPVVIDWRNATDGSPALDVAMTALIMAEVAVGDDPALATGSREFVRGFHTLVGPFDAIDDAIAYRTLDPNFGPDYAERIARAGKLLASLH